MKLTPNQKELLACIKNKQIRKEVKKEFKKKITFYHTRWKLLDEIEPIVFENGKLETDNPKIQDFLSQHPMCEKKHLESQRFVMTPKGLVPMSDEISNMIDKGEFKTWYSTSAEEVNKKFDELANKFMPNEKGNEIVSEEKAKEISLNNECLQKVLSETHDVKFFRDLQNICVKCQNYEYATKFRQKVRDILVTLSTEKLVELVQNGTIDLSDMTRAIGCKKDKSANDVEKQFTLEDMRKIYVNGILDNQNLLVTPETCQITFDMHLRNVEKKQ